MWGDGELPANGPACRDHKHYKQDQTDQAKIQVHLQVPIVRFVQKIGAKAAPNRCESISHPEVLISEPDQGARLHRQNRVPNSRPAM
jgi:hypothetical protein